LRAMNADKSNANGGGQVAVAFAQNMRDEVREMDVVGALAGKEEGKQTVFYKPAMQVRRITPLECERLQGFPDNYTAITVRKNKKIEPDYFLYMQQLFPGISEKEARLLAADGPRYKALGNSMAVPVMRWIGERILETDRIIKGC
jgi:site-specific DNA-cytosine methylase